MPTRKEVLKTLAALPVGVVAGKGFINSPSNKEDAEILSEDGKTLRVRGDETFRKIGVEPLINCRGTYTLIGGSLLREPVRQMMNDASGSFIQFDELSEAVGQRLGKLTGAEYGIVSSGCSGCIKQATIACVTGGNPEKLIRIPDLTGFEKREVIIPRNSRNPYDHAVRNVGVDVITVDNMEEFQKALSPRTAMIYIIAKRSGPLGLKNVSTMASEYNIPVFADAADEDLVYPNPHLAAGATIVGYSGGKALRGPQCSGMMIGPKNLLLAAWQACEPHHGPGRDNKVGREEIMGLLAAVESWFKIDREEVWEKWLSWLETIDSKVSGINGIDVDTEVRQPSLPGMKFPGKLAPISNHSPVLKIQWDPDKLHLSSFQLQEKLGRTKPRIDVGKGSDYKTEKDYITITAWMMRPGDAEVVANRVHELLSGKYPSSDKMEAPANQLTGHWKVDMKYFTSHSEHTFFIEKQDGNWLEGTHKAEFSTRPLKGTVEGRKVKLLSTEQMPGDHLENIFTGTLSRDGKTISGNIFLGEYLTAKFEAKKQSPTSHARRPINVPGGPPLAN